MPQQQKGAAHENDPNFNIYQDIQSQYEYSATQLALMGYRGDDLLKAFYRNDKIRARQASGPVTAPQTSEQQEVLAATKTHSNKFIVTGGSYIHHVHV
jgi:hypothetical protein